MTITQMALVGAALLVAIIGFALLASRGRGHRYEPCPIMTDNELEFFRRLEQAHKGKGYVFPQVSMAAVMRPTSGNGKQRLAAFRAISQKRIDFAIYSRSMELLCVVELDDRTHNARNDAIRDQMLATAGIKTIRWNSRKKPDADEITRKLHEISPETIADRQPAIHQEPPITQPSKTRLIQSIIERDKERTSLNEQAGRITPPARTMERGKQIEDELKKSLELHLRNVQTHEQQLRR